MPITKKSRRGKKDEYCEEDGNTDDEVPVTRKSKRGQNAEDLKESNGKVTAVEKDKASKKGAKGSKGKVQEDEEEKEVDVQEPPQTRKGSKKAGNGNKTQASTKATKTRAKRAGTKMV